LQAEACVYFIVILAELDIILKGKIFSDLKLTTCLDIQFYIILHCKKVDDEEKSNEQQNDGDDI